jgi:hypothetical protein
MRQQARIKVPEIDQQQEMEQIQRQMQEGEIW